MVKNDITLLFEQRLKLSKNESAKDVAKSLAEITSKVFCKIADSNIRIHSLSMDNINSDKVYLKGIMQGLQEAKELFL